MCSRQRELAFRCVIVGRRAAARTTLRRRVAALGLEGRRVAARRVYARGARRPITARRRCLRLPCKVLDNGDRDGIPNVLVEAMAQACRSCQRSVSGIPELVDNGETGLLVPPGNTTELAAAIELLLRDRDLRAAARDTRARVGGTNASIRNDCARVCRSVRLEGGSGARMSISSEERRKAPPRSLSRAPEGEKGCKKKAERMLTV